MNGKNIIFILITIVTIFLFTGCGIQPKSEEEIKADIENHYLWKELNITTTDFQIEKRQTNTDAKEDIVYVSMYGENDVSIAEQYYIATYNLYNEGWILDNLERNYDYDHYSSVEPKRGNNYNAIIEFIDSHEDEILEYCSFNYTDFEYIDPHVCQYERPNGIDIWAVTIKYHCGWFNENVKIFLDFSFEFVDSETGYDWIGYINDSYTQREIELTDEILGEWIDSSWESPYYASFVISDYTENSCWCDYSSYTYYGGDWLVEEKTYSGWLDLDFRYDETQKEISDVYLSFPNNEGRIHSNNGSCLVIDAIVFVVSERDLVFSKTA